MPHAPLNVWVVVVNYNGLTDTRKCLQSLQRQRYAPCSVVVVDNASDLDPLPVLRAEFPDCSLLHSAINRGWAGGNNLGIRYALEHGADQVLLLNNDTVVAPEMIERLVQAAEAQPRYGIIGPVVLSMDEPAVVTTDGCTFNAADRPGFFDRLPVPLQRKEPPAVTEVDLVNGCCMMVAAAVLRRAGFIDERFFLMHEESELCLRACRAGFRCGILAEALVRHKEGSSSFQRAGNGLRRYYDARNLWLLLRKHPRGGRGRRSPQQTCWEYLKYVYYRYSLECEEGQAASADAVLAGLSDALRGRYGAFVPGRRAAVPALRWLFEAFRRWRGAASVCASSA